MSDLSPQEKLILDYIKVHGGITPAEALLKCGVYRLSGRIYDLKEKGYTFKVQMIAKKQPSGKAKRYARYMLA